MGVQDTPPDNLLGLRQLRPIINQVRLFRVLHPVRHRPALPADNLEGIREVEFALRILHADEFQGTPDLRQLEGVES
jgi:hypothetical protein